MPKDCVVLPTSSMNRRATGVNGMGFFMGTVRSWVAWREGNGVRERVCECVGV
jgi:hypothetical protein